MLLVLAALGAIFTATIAAVQVVVMVARKLAGRLR
jgi:hypothetical protein